MPPYTPGPGPHGLQGVVPSSPGPGVKGREGGSGREGGRAASPRLPRLGGVIRERGDIRNRGGGRWAQFQYVAAKGVGVCIYNIFLYLDIGAGGVQLPINHLKRPLLVL